MTPAAELTQLGAFYGTSVDKVLAQHGAALALYAEWVLGHDAFALVTLGDPATLALHGTATSATRLLRAAGRWPAAITGIKLDPARREEPTLYVRPLCPWADGAAWLRAEAGVDTEGIVPARTLYGLGFQGERVKTYALAPDGFISWRMDGGAHPPRETKEYRADVEWDSIAWPDSRWAAVGALGRTLGFRTAGHVGRSSGAGELKVYVERVGGIPTDRSLA